MIFLYLTQFMKIKKNYFDCQLIFDFLKSNKKKRIV